MEISKKNMLLNIYLFAYFFFSFFFLESFLNFITIKSFDINTVFINLPFLISISLIFFGISKLFKKKISFIIISTVIFITSFIYASQIGYYKFFKTFYTFYSLLNSKQVLELRNDTITFILNNIFILLATFIPFILFLFLYKSFDIKRNLRLSLISLIVSIMFHFLGVGILHLTPKDDLSTFDFYFNVHGPNSTLEKLGLLNYMRLDVKRNLFGSNIETMEEPKLEIKNPTKKDLPIIISEDEKNKFNLMDIDFDKFIKEETNEDLINMHKYFANLSPTKKNDYSGSFKDYNLILLTAEGFSHLAIDKELTPTIYKMVHEGYNFENFYTPIWGVSTSDGEYVANTGLIPKSGVWSFKESSKNNMYFSMGNRLGALGYTTRAYHNHTYTFYDRDKSHPNMGYEYKGLGNGLNVTATWPESDLEMMELTIPEYIDDDKFHAYYMTVSGHMLYNFTGNYIAAKNRDLVNDLPYSETVKAYLATNIELDKALEYLLEKLEEKGIADKTLIALSADHYPYGLEHSQIEELEGKDVDRNFELYKNTFIVYSKGMEAQVIRKASSSLDIIPTLSNLLGLEYDSRLLMGSDIFSDSDPLVIFLNRSFITDKGRYNSKTKEFIANEGIKVDEEYIQNMKDIVATKFYYSSKILDLDYYRKILE